MYTQDTPHSHANAMPSQATDTSLDSTFTIHTKNVSNNASIVCISIRLDIVFGIISNLGAVLMHFRVLFMFRCKLEFFFALTLLHNRK